MPRETTTTTPRAKEMLEVVKSWPQFRLMAFKLLTLEME